MSGLTNPKVRGARGLGRFEFSKAPSSRSSRLIQKVNRKPHFTTVTTMDEEHIEKPSKRKRNAAKAEPKEQRQHSATKEAVADIEDLFSDKEIHKIRASLPPWRRITQTKEIPVKEEEGEGEGERRAYGVWVSEVMLQQTRVQTVIDYYNRWMLKWPTLHHLAQASLEEVNEMWAGLGYYRRARFLLEGARMIVAGGDGFPKIVSSLLKVPGIGDYTAGAIASIAFKEVVPVVDGNVIRVLARLKAISANPKDKVTVKKFWKLAAQLVDPHRPGDFNQSLMELGATLCTPLNPSCSSCPVSGECRALAISKLDKLVLITDYPAKSIKLKQRHEFSAVCVVEISGRQDLIEGDQSNSVFLLVKRPDEGLLAGLWEFPSVMLGKEAALTRRRKEMNCFLKKSFRLDPQRTCSILLREDVGEFTHIFSHIRLKVYVELLIVHLKGLKTLLFLCKCLFALQLLFYQVFKFQNISGVIVG
ncbi:A/G-specific adenine DNA glycosylase [Salix suchowensis]|nr:A/G-specific adenine DNA glycosylase [Salix suchowensis]